MFLFFGLISALFAGFIYMAVFEPDPRYRQLETKAENYKQQLKKRIPVDTVNIILPVGERVRIDKNVFISRGMKNKMALIDVIITELDPQTSYRHVVPKRDTGNKIRLGGHSYQLKSITASKIKLQRIKN